MMIFKNIKKGIRKIMPLLLSSSLLVGGLTYGRDLEERISKPKISIDFNYKHEDAQKSTDYYVSNSSFSQFSGFLWTNVPLSSSEKNQVENIMNGIKNEDIKSYQELVEKSKDFSENQKIVLLSAIGGILAHFNYEDSNEKVSSQDTFFEKLQDSLESGEQNGLGVCRQISSHLEKLANDIEKKASAVTGAVTSGSEYVGHVYVILKTKNGNSIVDYSEILTTNTKNIEKTLEAYQKYNGTIVFQHLFFEDAEFKYRLITKDGEHFLDFIEYDESFQPMKEALVNSNIESDLTLEGDLEDFLKSFKFNYKGFFVKVGEIKGDSGSPMNKMTLFQTGYKRNFLILDIININPDINFIYGKISQDAKIDDKALGVTGNLIINTNNEKGFNLSSRIAGGIIFPETGGYAFFHDFLAGAGISYKILVKDIDIQPYAFMQYFPFIEDIGSGDFRLTPEELILGSVFNFNSSKKTEFSIEPYYLWRIWEDKFGINTSFGSRHLKINTKGDITKSNYEFSPDKMSFELGLEANFKNLSIGSNYKIEKTNYDGEKDQNKSLNIYTNIKFPR